MLLGCNQTSELSFPWHRTFTNAISVTRVSPTHQTAPSHFLQGLSQQFTSRKKARQNHKSDWSRSLQENERKEKKKTDQKQRVNFMKAKPQIIKNLPLRQWWEMRRAECPIAETFKIKQWKTRQMALHKPDVSLGKGSRKINLSGFPFFPRLGSLTRHFLEPYMLLDHLYHWAAQKRYTYPLQTSPQHSRFHSQHIPMSLRGTQGSFLLQKEHSFAGTTALWDDFNSQPSEETEGSEETGERKSG